MTKWEYGYQPLDFGEGYTEETSFEFLDKLNVLGKEGWELIGFLPRMEENMAFALLKRPLQN